MRLAGARLSRQIESAVESGAGAVWQRARFGTVRPRVQIPGPRPKFVYEIDAFGYRETSAAGPLLTERSRIPSAQQSVLRVIRPAAANLSSHARRAFHLSTRA